MAGAAGQLRGHLTAQKTLLYAIVLRFVAAAASFLVTFIVARSYGASVSGEFALLAQTVLVFGAFAIFGNDQLLVRRIAGFVANGRTDLARLSFTHARRLVLVGAFVLGALLLALSPKAGLVGASPALMAIAAVALPFHALLYICAASVRGANRPVESQWLSSVQQILMLGLVIAALALWEGRPSIGLGLGFALSLMLAAGLAALASHRVIRQWDAPEQRHPDDGKTNSFKLGLTVAVDMAFVWCAFGLTGALLGTADVGVLRVCLQFVTVITMLALTLDSVLAPRFAAAYSRGDHSAARRILNRSIAFLMLAGGVPLLLMIVFAEPLLGLMGDEFRAGAGALRLLALGHLAVIAAGAAGSAISMKGREAVSLKLALASFATAIPLLAVLTPSLGLLGPAIAVAVVWLIRSQGSHLYARMMLREPG